jgi:Nucleotidyl transferase AbiEii toxin, Type IV TA system
MIDYPEDERLREQAKQHDLQAPVLIRDIVRVVEVLNLRAQRFFNKRSVLSGSMALRCFGSPRFTVYDADFSTSAQTVDPPASMTDMLRYSDEDLDIIPAAAIAADQRETLIQIEPIRFDAVFTSIVLADQDQQFKADVSFRGLLLDGKEAPFDTPYSLDLWSEPPTVWVMDPVEVLAEKILGWCVHGLVKHYADAAWITIAAQSPGSPLAFTHPQLRDILRDKLEIMSELQPDVYRAFPSVDAVVGKLAQPPQFDQVQWQKLVYLQAHRAAYSQEDLRRIVQETLTPGLRRSQIR